MPKKPLAAILLILWMLSGCRNLPDAESIGGIQDRATSSREASIQTGGPSGTDTPAVDIPSAGIGSGTPHTTTRTDSSGDSSPVPEVDWRYLPVMPGINQHVFDIYRDGQAQGRNPLHFSVIGDCQAIPLVFLGPFERGELEPDSSEGYLWDAIRQFKGSFSRTGMAVRGGFNAASILSPLQADPHFCLSGETPLTCEYRLHNPSIVFITLETWLDPETIDRYESYLRQILDYVIAKGTVPILMTKADMAEMGNGVPVINPAIVRVAGDYDVPVINFWRSAQSLENGGIDPNREGFHLSPEGFKLKNILALRTLYKLWTQVEKGSQNPGGTDAPGTPTVTSALTVTPGSPGSLEFTAPDCQGGCIFAGTAISNDGAVTSNGVLAINYPAGKLTQILGEGFDLQDVSADGQRLLVNDSTALYEITLGHASTRLISDSYFSFGKQGAYWNADDSRVIYLDRNDPIQTETGDAIDLFPSMRNGEIYFESGTCAGKADCRTGGVYRLDAKNAVTRLESYAKMVFSPDGKVAAFLDPAAATQENHFHIPYLLLEAVDQGAASRKWIHFPGAEGFMVHPEVREYAFSPENDELFILYDVYSDYYERSLRLQAYGYDLATRTLSDLGEMAGVGGSQNPRLVWSPRESKVLLFLTEQNSENQYALSIYQVDPENTEGVTAYSQKILSRSDYFYITNLFWR
ncbi:MAG: SGNH/GDSL hydrolase family protein [Anaerolineales bacterium]|nr:SGNH/GDSL hydrolase family protein [Anaerolineales bacterium]